MKIICESCGAKYSIADEKVAGKVFKIRCKKCSEVIVVRGDQPEEADEETRVFDYGSDAVWHVVMDGDQQGPLTPGQIGDLLADGRIDWEAFVWREGFDNWQPAKDVPELVSAVMAGADAADAGAAAADMGATRVAESDDDAYSADAGYGGDMGADPFAGEDDGGLSGLVDQPPVAASPAGGTADLFAGVAGGDDFSGGEPEPAEPQAAAPAASPRVSADEAMTGARNENSVLFSLSNLQALATSSGSSTSGAPPASERPGMAQGEGSGLIDIRALASASQSMKDSAPEQRGGADQVEDLLAVGGGGSTFGAAAIAAPVAAEKPEGNNKLILGLVAALGVVVLALGGVVLALAFKDDPQPVAATGEVSDAPPAAAAAAAVPSAGAAEAAKPAADTEEDSAEDVDEPEDEPKAKATDDDEEEDEGRARSRDRERDRRSSKKHRAKSSRSDSKPAAPSPAKDPDPPAPKPKRNSANSSIDDLLSSAIGGGGSKGSRNKRRAPAADSNLPDTPDRNSVKSALTSVASAVQSCGKGQSGVAMTKVTVAGKTGRVTNAVVSGQFAGTPVGSCVAQKVRRARFPKFKQSTFSVSFPYRI